MQMTVNVNTPTAKTIGMNWDVSRDEPVELTKRVQVFETRVEVVLVLENIMVAQYKTLTSVHALNEREIATVDYYIAQKPNGVLLPNNAVVLVDQVLVVLLDRDEVTQLGTIITSKRNDALVP
jgi:hypothetical protein